VRKEIMTTAEMLIQEGIEKGIEKGREEGSYQKACQTARAMLKEGSLDYKKIASFTSLTLEDIERMAKQIRDL
jgi:predicted transposase/invertase (TIGR01784 family)